MSNEIMFNTWIGEKIAEITNRIMTYYQQKYTNVT